MRQYLSTDGESWTPDIVGALVFTTESDAHRALATAEDATGIAEGHESWYVVKEDISQAK
jgi:hypothetical protein